MGSIGKKIARCKVACIILFCKINLKKQSEYTFTCVLINNSGNTIFTAFTEWLMLGSGSGNASFQLFRKYLYYFLFFKGEFLFVSFKNQEACCQLCSDSENHCTSLLPWPHQKQKAEVIVCKNIDGPYKWNHVSPYNSKYRDEKKKSWSSLLYLWQKFSIR